MRAVDAIAEWFDRAGITHYFGYAGGAVWPLLDALVDYPHIEGIQAKHEAHAVHMADIYYRTTGRIAPVIVSKGPGLLNAVGGVASAIHDTAALLVIAGGGSTHVLGKGGMQEMYYKGFEDATSVFRPVTKGAWMAVRPDTVIDVFNTAYRTAVNGRPGPVFVQLPFDVQMGRVEGEVEAPSRRVVSSRLRGDRQSMEAVVELLRGSARPVLLAGGGAARSAGGPAAFRALVERLQVPFATTLTAKGIVSERHPLSLGPVGRSGTDSAAEATRAADLVIAVGARFSDNHTANWRNGLVYDVPKTRIVHVDIDAGELGRNYPADVAVVADAATFLTDLVEFADADGLKPSWDPWVAQVTERHREWVASTAAVTQAATDPIHPGRLVHEVGEALGDTGRVFIDVGDVIQYAEPYLTITQPDAWHINAGMAEMGWASSGVLGALVADRDRPAIAVTGDGAFNMVSNVLASAVEYDLPAIWVILDNNELGIERKGADTAFTRSHPWYSFVRKDTGEAYNPDYVALAEAHGALGERIERAADLAPALARALASGRPYVLDVVIDTTVPTYFAAGIDRAYPHDWGRSYPMHSGLRIADAGGTA
ncbi:thiamine pyrophosphate-binding protein [Dactylosporangium sp. NPDC005572]|uniref:thiamine pyrophosphate-binding protein n=1 Tax=Dactylosporangium sp. NPDC005572 TaxID=3156889 RepID=UPI0033B3333F